MSEAPETSRYLEPTRRGRWLFLLSILGFAGFLASHALWVPALLARFDERNPCVAAAEIQFLAVYLFALSWLPALYFARFTWLIFRARQCPHPKAWVLFRTSLWTGHWLWFPVALGAGLTVFLLKLPLWMWMEVQPLALLLDSGC